MDSLKWMAAALISLLPSLVIAAAPLEADLERSVKLMTKITGASSPTFSPDGKQIAFVSNLTGSPQVWTVRATGGWPRLVTAFDDPIGSVSWSPGGSDLAFSVAPGGGMNTQVYLAHPDGTNLRRLTDGGKENNWLGVWSHDGQLLTLASNRRTSSAMDDYVYGVATGSLKLVTENRGTGVFQDVTRNNKRALLRRVVSRGDSNLYLVEVATGKETLLTPHVPPGDFFGEFSPDGRTVYLASNAERDRQAFARINISKEGVPGPEQLLVARDDAELDDLAIAERGSIAALLWNVGGKSELEILDLRTKRTIRRPKLAGEIASGMRFSRDGRLLAMAVSGAAMPSEIWVLEVATGVLTRVTESAHAGVDLEKLVRPELRRFRAHDGIELSGWLYRPASGQAPLPTVLFFHGGPEGQERPFFNSTYQALLARGIAIFAPNVRGSTGFGKKFVDLDNGELRVNAVRDIRSCVDFLVSSGVGDRSRIGIMGGSYGGYMVMAGLTEYPELFAAGADYFGVVNFETFFKNTEPWMAAISKTEYGDPDTQIELLRRLSPIHKVDRVRAPTIVLHGANDTNVPVVEAEQVVESLKKRNVPVEYFLFPDEGHGFRKLPNRIRATISVVSWFDRYLKADSPRAGQGSSP